MSDAVQISWGETPIAAPFRFSVSTKPDGKGRSQEFELPSLSSDSLPWELIPFSILAVKEEGSDLALAGEAFSTIVAYITKAHPQLAAAIRRTGDHGSDVLKHIIKEWVDHAQIDPKA